MSRLIDADVLSEHKFLSPQYTQVGGRRNGKTLENINLAYQKGWNDAIDAVIDKAPTIEERPKGKWETVTVTGLLSERESKLDIVKCPFCGTMRQGRTSFCSWCGADMRGDSDED